MVPDSAYYADYNQFISFSILNLKNPATLASSETFQLSFYEQQYAIMNQNGSIVIKASAGSMSSISVTPLSSQIRLTVPYTFSFITENNVVAGGKVIVQVPYDVVYQSGLLGLAPIVGI
jgi:hypothetical protein